MKLTKLKMKDATTVYTDLSLDEVRHYLQGGSKACTVRGWVETTMTTELLISVHAIVYAYSTQVEST